MEQPPGFEVSNGTGQRLVCKLNKALYGLRQAPRAWFQTLKNYLVAQLGFQVSKADLSLFIRVSAGTCLVLMVYVDDIVLTRTSAHDIGEVVRQLHSKFALKDMGHLSFFLGVDVKRTTQGLLLSQKKYIMELLQKAGMVEAAMTPTPMLNTPKLTVSDNSPLFFDIHLYRSVVGMLQYVCVTRPDISFCVNKLSQFMNSPSDNHWRAVKRVLRYLAGTLDHGLYFSKGQPDLVCYSDADWASSVDDRRSISGYVVYIGPNLIAWCSKKQSVVSRSSAEAEYHSLANCVSELLWIKQLMDEVGIAVAKTPVIWCDNSSAVSVAENPTHHARMKHVDIDHHFEREKILAGLLQVNFVPSDQQIADVLTKPVTPKNFAWFRRALRVVSFNELGAQKSTEPREC